MPVYVLRVAYPNSPYRLNELDAYEWDDDVSAATAAHAIFEERNAGPDKVHAMVVMRQSSSWLRRTIKYTEVARFARKEQWS